MAFRRIRRRFDRFTSATNAGRLVVWVSVAVAAGALPDLLIGASKATGLPEYALLIVAFCITAALALAWAGQNHRKSGIAVFVHLPGRGDDESPLTHLSDFADLALRRHRAWFRAGPEPPEERLHAAADRVWWTLQTIDHRLAESIVAGHSREPLHLYLQCRQEEAAELGRRLHPWVTGHGDRDDPLARTALEVCYLSHFARDDHEQIHRIDLARVGRSDAADLPPDCTIRLQPTGAEPPSTSRIAIIVRASLRSRSDPAGFVSTALRAVSGDTSAGYLVREDDICPWALVVEVDPTQLVKLLCDGSAHHLVARIRREYRAACVSTFAVPSVEARLICDGPTTLVLAIAAVIGDLRLIPWRNERIAAPTQDLFALVDGDDVGARMEQLLLHGDSAEAIRYSGRVDDAMVVLTERLSATMGVTHLSTGGDSAMFRMHRAAVAPFASELQQQRSRLQFAVSCGIGPSLHDAFVALRLAKTSGKNRTAVRGTAQSDPETPQSIPNIG